MNKTINFLVPIPKGEIELRDDRINKTWKVKIDSFLLSKYLVTKEFYERIVNETPSVYKGKEKPVENVTWIDAVKFCNALSLKENLNQYYIINEETNEAIFDSKANGYRLPTEAEWEYSCKAGSSDIRYGNLDEIAWYKSNSEQNTHTVGLKQENVWGLYDMLGNVWEWCSDIYDEEMYGEYRIFRGGGWFDEARGCIATNRRRSHPTSFKIDDLGFRIAKSL